MTDPEARAAARQEAEVAALEAAIVTAVTGALTARVAAIGSSLRDAFGWATTQPAQWLGARRRAARALRATRPDVARQVGRLLPRAAGLGAQHAGGELPDEHDPAGDPLVVEILDGLDDAVTRSLADAADAVMDGSLDTAPKVDAAVARVDAAQAQAARGVGDVVARTVAGGTAAVAETTGVDLLWRSERGACLVCTSLNGAVAAPGDRFKPVRKFTPRVVKAGYGLPPDPHPNCRCQVIPATPGMADALRREAEREVARGESEFDPLKARLAAVDSLLTAGSRLPKTVQARAARDLARKQFSRRDQRPAS